MAEFGQTSTSVAVFGQVTTSDPQVGNGALGPPGLTLSVQAKFDQHVDTFGRNWVDVGQHLLDFAPELAKFD